MKKKRNKTKKEILNKHVHDNETMNADLMMMVVVVVMVNDDVIDYHYGDDHDHHDLHDLFHDHRDLFHYVDVVVDIV
jgi:hypothetical protein